MEDQQLKIDAGKWRTDIKTAEERLQSWRSESKKYIEIYEQGKCDGSNLEHFNILFTNTETLRSNVFNNPPEPRVTRRHRGDANVVAKSVAELLERALDFSVEDADLEDSFKPVINEALLSGFGQMRVRYEPTVIDQPVVGPDGLPVTDEAGQPVTEPTIAYQTTGFEQVDFDKFIWGPGRRWSKVPWVAFEDDFTEDEIIAEFGLDKGTFSLRDFNVAGSDKSEQRCRVYEVWDKKGKQVFFLVDGHDEALKVTDDPLGLDGFFPCPRPIQFLRLNSSTTPYPEYRIYKKAAEKLAEAAKRKAKIIEYLKAAGIYDKASKEIAGLLTAKDGDMIPADMNLLGEGQQPVIGKSFEMLPIDVFARVLAQLELSIQEWKAIIYELTGISDIMRGQSVASESATAQRIKGNFGTLRVQERQKEVARFVRDLIRLMGEIIAEHYEPQVLQMMTGLPVDEDSIAMMRDDAVRAFNIDIEDESTIKPDEEAAKANAVELLTAVGQYFTTIGPMLQNNGGLIPLDVAKEILLSAVRQFKGSRSIEDAINKIQMPQPPAQPVSPGAGGVGGAPNMQGAPL